MGCGSATNRGKLADGELVRRDGQGSPPTPSSLGGAPVLWLCIDAVSGAADAIDDAAVAG